MADEWADLREWLGELLGDPEEENFALALLHRVEPEQIHRRLGDERLIAFMVRAEAELRQKCDETTVMARFAVAKFDALRLLKIAETLEAMRPPNEGV
jgi:hypothetical protein